MFDKMKYLIALISKKIVEKGFCRTVLFITHYVSEKCHEKLLGIDTSGEICLGDLGFDNPSFINYAPSDYYGFNKVMKLLNIREGKEVFLDFGSGKGRTLIMAAMFPFYKVIGVEVSEQLNAIAEKNIKRVNKRLRCKNIEFVTSEASKYIIPQEVSIIYFFNPFTEDVLSTVFSNIKHSIISVPRKIVIIYKNITHLEKSIGKPKWLIKTSEVSTLFGQSYVIYKTKI